MADEYTPTTKDVENCYVYAGSNPDGSLVSPEHVLRAEYARWIAAHDREVAAKAWGEGHRHPQRRDPDDGCRCGAWADYECGCGLYGSGRLLSLDDNPYREGSQ